MKPAVKLVNMLRRLFGGFALENPIQDVADMLRANAEVIPDPRVEVFRGGIAFLRQVADLVGGVHALHRLDLFFGGLDLGFPDLLRFRRGLDDGLDGLGDFVDFVDLDFVGACRDVISFWVSLGERYCSLFYVFNIH